MKNSIYIKIKKIVLFSIAGLLGVQVQLKAQSIPTNEKQTVLKSTAENKTTERQPLRKTIDKKRKASKVEPAIKRTGTSSVKASSTK